MSDLPPPTPPDAPSELPAYIEPPPPPPPEEPTPTNFDPGGGVPSNDPLPKDDNEKTLGLVMHLLQFSGIVFAKIPFVGLVAPLILWLMKRDQSPYLDAVGKEVINFQINLGVAVLVGLLLCVIPGIIVGIAGLVLVVIAALKTNEGKSVYRYPWIYRILK